MSHHPPQKHYHTNILIGSGESDSVNAHSLGWLVSTYDNVSLMRLQAIGATDAEIENTAHLMDSGPMSKDLKNGNTNNGKK